MLDLLSEMDLSTLDVCLSSGLIELTSVFRDKRDAGTCPKGDEVGVETCFICNYRR